VLPLTLHSCVATLDQAIGATFGYTTFQQAIGATFGYTTFQQAIGATFGYTTFQQAIGATFGYTTFQQTIGAAFGYTAFNQAIRPAFSDDGLGGSGGESVNCKNREGDAEKDLAFHDGVLRGVIGWYGADVTPEIFYENFIELMVTIDASNGCQSPITGQ
jgi:hypothetical protein